MQRALVEMQDREKTLSGKKEKTSPAARTVYVSLDRADAFIEGGPDGFDSLLTWRGEDTISTNLDEVE